MMHRRLMPLRLYAVALLLGSFAAGARAAEPALPQGVARVTSVEGITEYRLPNGLRVLLFPDASKQTITVNVTYLVGSRDESYGETGMAHLLEHLLFKGSTRHTNIPQELSTHGSRPNGTTSFDRTNYYETFQASDANLDWALDLEADRMVNSFIAKKDLDSEMTVVRNEFESGENNPVGILFQRVQATAYLWHNYGKPTIGARADIENVPIERLQRFYRNYYQPDNAVLLVAGNIDEAKTLALVAAKFGAIPKPERVLQKTYTAEPPQDGERSVTLRRVGDTQAAVAMYHIPAGSHADAAAIDVLLRILGDTPAGRLHKALVETEKAAETFAFPYKLHDPGLAAFGAIVRKEKPLDPAREGLLQVVEAAGATAPAKEEVDRARTQLLKEIEMSLNNSERVGLQLSNWMAMGDWRLLFLHRDRIRKVTEADVQRVASAYLKPANRTLGVFVPTEKPERAEVPATPDVAALLEGYKGDAEVAAGEAFDPSPANIDARTLLRHTGGISLALLPKKTRGGVVVANLVLRFGDAKSLAGRVTPAEMAGAMLMRGSKKHTRQQIEDELDRLKARVSVSGGPAAARVSLETRRENLPAVLSLVAEVLREPAFPESEFAQLKQEQLAGLEEQKNDPQAIAFNAFERHLNPYPKEDVRYTPTPEEETDRVKAATLADARKFHADFYGASQGELAVVGDFDEKAIVQVVGDLFGNWKSPRPFARVARTYKEVPAANETIQTPDKANAVFVGGMSLPLRDDDPDYPALLLGNYMLGGGFLNSRIATRLRQKEGLSYGAGSWLSVHPLDRVSTFGTYAIYAPQNAARLEAALKEELARALKDGFTAEEVDSARGGYLQSRQVSRAQDPELSGKLAEYRFLDRTLAWDAAFEAKIRALTPEQIGAALRKHLDPARLSTFKAGDFAKAAK